MVALPKKNWLIEIYNNNALLLVVAPSDIYLFIINFFATAIFQKPC